MKFPKRLNVPKEDVVFALDAIQDPVSLFEPIYHDGGDPIYVMDQISDERNKDVSWIEEIALREAMHKLNEREKMILSMRFFEGKTQMEVADEIGISQAQVSTAGEISDSTNAKACENRKRRQQTFCDRCFSVTSRAGVFFCDQCRTFCGHIATYSRIIASEWIKTLRKRGERQMKISDFQTKDVINIVDGKKLGQISDLELDLRQGRIDSIVVPNSSRFFGLFGGGDGRRYSVAKHRENRRGCRAREAWMMPKVYRTKRRRTGR